MKCPYCSHIESKVIDSRPADDFSTIRRRRECLKCAARFTTYEKIETIPLIVVKKDGSRQPFNRNKILKGIMKACEKRPVSIEQMEQMLNEIESHLHRQSQKEIPSDIIGEEIMNTLKNVDEVAYVRFASVYKDFQDINSFMQELKTIIKEQQ